MGIPRSFISNNHRNVSRDYSLRNKSEKPNWADRAKRFDVDYWDKGRETGYGGYYDDGRWADFAQKLVSSYDINDNDSILDIGCGKGFLLNALQILKPGLTIQGVDISSYAVQSAPSKIKNKLMVSSVEEFNFNKASFDFIFSLNTLHNLKIYDLFSVLTKIQMAAKNKSYIIVESYRNESEKWNLMQWQLTCECFFTPKEWVWIFNKTGYKGDYEFIFFE